MNNNIFPPSSFGAGTTYTGREKHIVAPEVSRPPRIARTVGAAGLRDSVAPPRIYRPEESFSPEVQRRRELERILRFPRRENYDDDKKDGYDNRTMITEQSEAHAAAAYGRADADIKSIIERYVAEVPDASDVAALLRENDALRVELGSHIINKFETMSNLPDRVRDNFPNVLKNPNHKTNGYNGEKFQSRDYAAILALSMLDGTFQAPRWSSSDPAMHRQAAEMALGIWHSHIYANK